MIRPGIVTLLALAVLLLMDDSSLLASAEVETTSVRTAKLGPSVHLSGSTNRLRATKTAAIPRRRRLEEEADDTDDYYAEDADDNDNGNDAEYSYEAIDDDDNFEGSWVEKIYTKYGNNDDIDDDSVHHYTAGTAQSMFEKSPHEWSPWQWVFFGLLLIAFGFVFSCCIIPLCCARRRC